MAAHSVYIFIYDPWGLIVRSCLNNYSETSKHFNKKVKSKARSKLLMLVVSLVITIF